MRNSGFRIRALLYLAVLAIAAEACAPQPSQQQATPTTPAPTPTRQAAPTEAQPTPSPTPDTYEILLASGLRVAYPSGWTVERSEYPSGSDSVWFRLPDPATARIGLDVAPLPASERAIADPFTWVPNEGGYEIHWSREIRAAGLEGLLFVWGVRQYDGWQALPYLMAIFYDEGRELDLRLTTEFSQEQLDRAEEVGLADVVENDFAAFLLLLESMLFEPEEGQVSLSGMIRTGAELGEAKAHCAEGLYLVAESGYLAGQTSMLLLRVPRPGDQPAMLEDRQWIGRPVTVSGVYPAQEVFCEALICECEDYVLVTDIEDR